jgi:hypothetical protein
MMTEKVMRYQIADYLRVGDEFVLCGTGFSTLDEEPSAQSESSIYINNQSASSTIKSYETTFPFDTELMKSEEAVMAIYDIARNQKTGSDAELDYVRVELFDPAEDSPNIFKARKFRVAVEVSSISGEGGEAVKISGNLNGVGDFVDGTFDTTTKTFTEA